MSARTAVACVFFVHGALFGTWAARIPAIQHELSLDTGELGLALLAATLGAVLGLTPSGLLVSRVGSRTVVAAGLPVYTLALPLLALAPSLATLALALFVFGVAAGAVDVAMNAHGLVVERRVGRPILSSLHAGWSFGGLAGAGGGALAAAAGIEPFLHFVLAAFALGALGLVAVTRFLPADVDRGSAPASGFRRPPRRIAALGILAFCCTFAEGAAADWSAVYLAGPLEAGVGTAALGFAAFSVTMAVFRLLGDPLVLRWGPVALIRRGGLLAAGGLGLALVIGRPVVAIAGFACMGAGLAAVVPVVFRAAGSIPGIPAGTGIAALTTIGYSAFLLGPPTIGFLAEATTLPIALALVAVLLGILALMAPHAATGNGSPSWTEPHPP